MSKPTIKDLQEQLSNEKRLRIQAEDANISLQSKLEGSPKVREQLNMANGTVAELIKEVQTVKQYAEKVDAQNEILRESNATLNAEVETLKKDKDNFERNFNNINECYEGIFDNYEKLKVDYAEVNKEYKDLLDKFTEISAENVALKAEIERTNRHINLAENQLNREQQPTVINYHNCTFNK